MLKRPHWVTLLAVTAGLCAAPALGFEVTIDFEDYTLGPVAGQDGWYLATDDGGAATIVDLDNGPSAPGGKSLQLDTQHSFQDAGNWHSYIAIEKAITDVVAAGGPVVTFEYDLRAVTNSTGDLRIRATAPGGGTYGAHWWDFWCQHGSQPQPTSGTVSWVDSGPNWSFTGGWYHVKWKWVMGDLGDGQAGQFYSVEVDGVEVIKHHQYLPNTISGQISLLRMSLDDAGHARDQNDQWLVDNLVVRGDPLPSAPPVANAGPDVTQDPGSWTGVQLDGSGSTDDGTIVRYRWTIGWGWDATAVYDGPEAAPIIDLGPGTYDLVLTVFDDTGLRDTDTATVYIGPRPPVVDNVVGPWGIMHGDIYNTNASAAIPSPVDADTPFEVLNQAYITGPWSGMPTTDDCQIVFDAFGNLYFVSWNLFLESWTPDLKHRWRGHDREYGINELKLGENSIDNGAIIAGTRYIYTVGGGAADGIPSVYAFEKSTGQVQWITALLEQNWGGIQGRPKVTLYNDKLYVIGRNVEDYTRVYQIDASTGAIDWSSDCLVEMQWDEPNNAGTLLFLPDAFGAGLHGLYWNQKSGFGGGYDGYADMVGVKIDPASGATTMWGPAENADGPGLDRSIPIYSEVTGRIYTPSRNNEGWEYALYAWAPTTGFVAGTNPPEAEEASHGMRRAFALDFDGRTIHCPGEWDTVRSYTDNGDGTWGYQYRDFGGFNENGWGFITQGCLLKAANGDSILFIATESNVDLGNPDWHVPPKVQALNLSGPEGTNAPMQTWIASDFDPAAEGGAGRWTWQPCRNGPTPGPDGSIYVIQPLYNFWDGQRITRLGGASGPSFVCADTNCDGVVDTADIDNFVYVVVNNQPAPGCPTSLLAADTNGDGVVDTADIDSFVAAVVAGGCQ
jgi:hypothetical protein